MITYNDKINMWRGILRYDPATNNAVAVADKAQSDRTSRASSSMDSATANTTIPVPAE